MNMSAKSERVGREHIFILTLPETSQRAFTDLRIQVGDVVYTRFPNKNYEQQMAAYEAEPERNIDTPLGIFCDFKNWCRAAYRVLFEVSTIAGLFFVSRYYTRGDLKLGVTSSQNLHS